LFQAHRSCLRWICCRRCALARPDRAFEDNQTAGRDLGLAESDFALPSRRSAVYTHSLSPFTSHALSFVIRFERRLLLRKTMKRAESPNQRAAINRNYFPARETFF